MIFGGVLTCVITARLCLLVLLISLLVPDASAVMIPTTLSSSQKSFVIPNNEDKEHGIISRHRRSPRGGGSGGRGGRGGGHGGGGFGRGGAAGGRAVGLSPARGPFSSSKSSRLSFNFMLVPFSLVTALIASRAKRDS